ncbi:MAG TPA: hypothetical protein VIO32_06145 [Candidatus Baltobacteraceae bacterium]
MSVTAISAEVAGLSSADLSSAPQAAAPPTAEPAQQSAPSGGEGVGQTVNTTA